MRRTTQVAISILAGGVFGAGGIGVIEAISPDDVKIRDEVIECAGHLGEAAMSSSELPEACSTTQNLGLLASRDAVVRLPGQAVKLPSTNGIYNLPSRDEFLRRGQEYEQALQSDTEAAMKTIAVTAGLFLSGQVFFSLEGRVYKRRKPTLKLGMPRV